MITREQERRWNKTYRERHRTELNAKRVEKYRKIQNGRLKALLNDYDNGLTTEELCAKYRVIERNDND